MSHADEQTDALARVAQAQNRVQNLDANLPSAEITRAYAERRDALSKLIRWNENDRLANAIHRLMLTQQAIQDLREQGRFRRDFTDDDEDAFSTAEAEREAAMLELIAARKAARLEFEEFRAARKQPTDGSEDILAALAGQLRQRLKENP
jgi:hypothetical protein